MVYIQPKPPVGGPSGPDSQQFSTSFIKNFLDNPKLVGTDKSLSASELQRLKAEIDTGRSKLTQQQKAFVTLLSTGDNFQVLLNYLKKQDPCHPDCINFNDFKVLSSLDGNNCYFSQKDIDAARGHCGCKDPCEKHSPEKYSSEKNSPEKDSYEKHSVEKDPKELVKEKDPASEKHKLEKDPCEKDPNEKPPVSEKPSAAGGEKGGAQEKGEDEKLLREKDYNSEKQSTEKDLKEALGKEKDNGEKLGGPRGEKGDSGENCCKSTCGGHSGCGSNGCGGTRKSSRRENPGFQD